MQILPAERVDNYLSDIIKIPDWKSLLHKDRLEFLSVFQRQTFIHIYFHNIRMASSEIQKRRVPTLDEVIETGFRGIGGVCNEINVFSKLILVSLGFDAYNNVGNVCGGRVPNSHIMIIVRFSPSESYLLDMALANPLQEPVPLHQLPYSAMAAGYKYEYRDNGDGAYTRYQCGGGLMNGDFIGEVKEQARFTFTLGEDRLEVFGIGMSSIYTDVESSIFLRFPVMFRYTEFTETSCQFVLVFGKTIMIATTDTREVNRFTNLDEMKPHVEKVFPKLRKEDIESAWNVFIDIDRKIVET